MRLICAMLFVGVALGLTIGCGSSSPSDSASKKDGKETKDTKGNKDGGGSSGPLKLEGTYVTIEMEIGGEKFPDEVKGPEKDRTTVFTADTMTTKALGTDLTMKYKLDSSKSPAHIDFVMDEGKKTEMKLYGIVKLEGDTLSICNGGDKPGERPKEFKTGKGQRLALTIFKKK